VVAGIVGRILEANPDAQVIGIDQDAMAIKGSNSKFREFGDRVAITESNFAEFKPGKQKFGGILVDLGVSSAQFDIAERGFGFPVAPLDMRRWIKARILMQRGDH
jgi:16S rRNA (cytosine1402-N4)-methyltransferase